MKIPVGVPIAVLVVALAAHPAGSTAGSTADAESIRERVDHYLEDMADNACGTGVPFAERVDKAASILAALRNFIRTTRSGNPYLGEEDTIFLACVESNIDPGEWVPGGRLTSGVALRFEIDLSEQFSAHFARYYGIGDDGKLAPQDFRHDWARKIYAAFSCLRIPEASRR